jgi:hypothetical protein
MAEETTRLYSHRTEPPTHFAYTTAEWWTHKPHRRLWGTVMSLLKGSAREARKVEHKPCDLNRYSCTKKFERRKGRVLRTDREVLIDKSKARLGELEKAQRRRYLELEEWTLQARLVNETMHAARLLEIAAESEAQLAHSELDAVQAQVDYFILQGIPVEALTTPSLTAARIRLQACEERHLDACLRVQICRRHRQLQKNCLEQSAAALARSKQRYSSIIEEIVALRSAMEPISEAMVEES